jgi:hypothetical protein
MTTNETKTETKPIDTVAQLDTAFSSLITQREVWEAGTYAASNAELNALLGRSLDVLYKIKHFTELVGSRMPAVTVGGARTSHVLQTKGLGYACWLS